MMAEPHYCEECGMQVYGAKLCQDCEDKAREEDMSEAKTAPKHEGPLLVISLERVEALRSEIAALKAELADLAETHAILSRANVKMVRTLTEQENLQADLAAAREQADALASVLSAHNCTDEIRDALDAYRDGKLGKCMSCDAAFRITNETRRCPECAEKIGKVE